jgi:hypothetical protein
MAEYVSSVIVAPTGDEQTLLDFASAGQEKNQQNAIVIRIGDENGEGEWNWAYGRDFSFAGGMQNFHGHFTMKHCTFEKVERSPTRPKFQFQVEQKIGIAVFRDFVITCEDAGLPKNHYQLRILKGFSVR